MNHKDIHYGTQLLLTGKSQKGKALIDEFGALWRVAAKVNTVQFEKKRPGPFGLIFPMSGWNQDTITSNMTAVDNSRWVNLRDDRNFNISLEGECSYVTEKRI